MRSAAMMSTGDPVEKYGYRVSEAFARLMQLETAARRIFLNQPLFVPGLFQTEGYAEAIISVIADLKPTDPELSARVDLRMRRRKALEDRLEGTEPPHLWVPLDEAVLRHAVGGRTVMGEQIDHLVTLSRLKTVELAIMPMDQGAHAGLGGSFELHELADEEAAVFLEGPYTDELVESNPELAGHCKQKVQSMMASAVSGDAARALLETIKSEL
jgi:hypothetical protein